MAIDYARMQRTHKIHKAALTRAIKSGKPDLVVKACKAAVVEWNACGAWPDDWHRWNIAYGDAMSTMGYGYGARLDDI